LRRIDGDITRPSDEDVLAEAGAAGAGRILIRGDLDRACVAVVDTNGDGAFLAAVSLHLDDDGVWRESEWNSAAVLGRGQVHGVGYVYGRAPAGTEVDIAPFGRVQQVRANEAGWWLYMAGSAPGGELGGTAD
jgi:hypothetical protein